MDDQLIEISSGARAAYPDIYTAPSLEALEALAPLDARRYELMAERIARRAERARDRKPIEFLPEDASRLTGPRSRLPMRAPDGSRER